MKKPFHSLIQWLTQVANINQEMRREGILRVILLALIFGCFMVSLKNLFSLLYNPIMGTIYMLAYDLLALLVLVLVWRLNRNGNTTWAGISLLCALILIVTLSFDHNTIKQAFIVYVIPVMLSSFILTPASSFVFALLSIISYTVIFVSEGQPISEYSMFSIIGLVVLAILAWMVAHVLHNALQEQTEAYDATIQGWGRALELRDHETEGHSRRVTELTIGLARAMEMDGPALKHLRRGVFLHDIGKMGVPDCILLKPGPLTEEEWGVMKNHPQLAYDWLCSIPHLKRALDVPYCHHERWDGTGYPRGLKGEEIPLAARIFSVVDVWDALLSDRPYRRAWERPRAIEYIRQQAGIQFDPLVVETFLKIVSWDEETPGATPLDPPTTS